MYIIGTQNKNGATQSRIVYTNASEANNILARMRQLYNASDNWTWTFATDDNGEAQQTEYHERYRLQVQDWHNIVYGGKIGRTQYDIILDQGQVRMIRLTALGFARCVTVEQAIRFFESEYSYLAQQVKPMISRSIENAIKGSNNKPTLNVSL